MVKLKQLNALASGAGGTTGVFRGCLTLCMFLAGLWLAYDTRTVFADGGISVEVTVKTSWKGQDTPQRDISSLSQRKQTLLEKSKALPFRFCSSIEKIRPTSGEDREGFYMRYRCEGPRYDEFAEELHAFVEQEAVHHHPLWGKRGIPANGTYLIVGSSHLQQTTQAMVCQEHHFGSGLVLMEGWTHPKVMMIRYTFGNGAVIYHATNTYAIHLFDWPKHLAEQANVTSLGMFDRVIVGTTNSCDPPVKTTFAEDMKSLLTQKYGVACQQPEGPSFASYASVFQQPLLYVSMYATYARKRVQTDYNNFKRVHNHTATLKYLNARSYIKKMGTDEWECGSLSTKVKYDCVNNETARKKLHRCAGPRGAHTDLIAWDMIEFLNKNYRGLISPN